VQAKAIPAALRWFETSNECTTSDEPEAQARDRAPGVLSSEKPSLALRARQDVNDRTGLPRIITLIKPHYEVAKSELGPKGVLDPGRAAEVVEDVLAAMPGLGVRVLGCVESPVLGGKKKGRGTGNREWLALTEPLS